MQTLQFSWLLLNLESWSTLQTNFKMFCGGYWEHHLLKIWRAHALERAGAIFSSKIHYFIQACMNLDYHKYSNEVELTQPTEFHYCPLSQSASYQGFSLHVSVPLPNIKHSDPGSSLQSICDNFDMYWNEIDSRDSFPALSGTMREWEKASRSLIQLSYLKSL